MSEEDFAALGRVPHHLTKVHKVQHRVTLTQVEILPRVTQVTVQGKGKSEGTLTPRVSGQHGPKLGNVGLRMSAKSVNITEIY